MEVADKCTYKATMALRISEAIGQGKPLVERRHFALLAKLRLTLTDHFHRVRFYG